MVRGLGRFREYFKDHADSYVIIGGTACDVLLSGEGFVPRTTKDIDIVLVVENLTVGFVKRLWDFLKAGGYQSLQKDPKERKYYRFTEPARSEFPHQIELFSRRPDSIEGSEDARFTHITVSDDISSLSAILMDDAYYGYTMGHSSVLDGLHMANLEALICLKARAFIDLEGRRAKGEKIDERDIKKHKNDVFRLAVLFPSDVSFELPDKIRDDMIAFFMRMTKNMPDKAMLREMGAPNLQMDQLLQQLRRNFRIGD
jgi:hypothetical protein